jgi:hypothetical protein
MGENVFHLARLGPHRNENVGAPLDADGVKLLDSVRPDRVNAADYAFETQSSHPTDRVVVVGMNGRMNTDKPGGRRLALSFTQAFPVDHDRIRT